MPVGSFKTIASVVGMIAKDDLEKDSLLNTFVLAPAPNLNHSFQISLEANMYEKMRKTARNQNLSENDFVKKALLKYLSDIK